VYNFRKHFICNVMLLLFQVEIHKDSTYTTAISLTITLMNKSTKLEFSLKLCRSHVRVAYIYITTV